VAGGGHAANFASEWNSIYSAAKLKQDPQFPVSHILGTGAFTFIEYVEGDHWTGRRFDGYFRPAGHTSMATGLISSLEPK
jgi:hypothetical protein